MSIELGSQSKSIQYISIHKESTDSETTCNTDNRWSNPQLSKQSDYLVALSRFEIPLNKVPITKKMDNCLQVFRYNNETTNDAIAQHLEMFHNVEHLGLSEAQINNGERVTWEAGCAFLDASEQLDPGRGNGDVLLPQIEAYNMTQDANSIDMPACYSVYEFVKKLNAQIMETLLMNADQYMIRPKGYNSSINDKTNQFINT